MMKLSHLLPCSVKSKTPKFRTLFYSISDIFAERMRTYKAVKSPALRHRIFKFSKSKNIGSFVNNE
jgi:hypothetical protein